MTTSIQAKQDIETRVASWVQTYADTITKNYREYHIQTLKGNLSGNYPEYAREQLDAIENGTANLMWFKVYSGKRYYKIVQQFRLDWSDFIKSNPNFRGDSIAKRCAFNDYVDMLNKDGMVTDYQAYNWSNPF